jgi:hypothetical protein
MFYPVIAILVLSAIDFLEWEMAANEEYDVTTVFITFIIWLLVCVPCTFLGGA